MFSLLTSLSISKYALRTVYDKKHKLMVTAHVGGMTMN